jgi:hypothetical protein
MPQKHKPFQTICSFPLRSGATCCHFARSRGEGLGMGMLSLRAAENGLAYASNPSAETRAISPSFTNASILR